MSDSTGADSSVSSSLGDMVGEGSDTGTEGVADQGSQSTSGSGSGSGSASSSISGTSGSAAAAAAAASVSDWRLRVVSAANPLPEDYAPETRNIKGYSTRPFDVRAADDLEAMLAAAEEAGCPLYLVSAYRTPERQDALFRRKTNAFAAEGFPQEEAERQAAMWVARPYTSEHNLGLAVDIVSQDWYKTNSDLTAEFEETPHFAWLMQHCAEYGFILRYPLGKENITGVTYEPWHYRYVGKEAAHAIMDSGLTLEEYCA